MEEKKLDWNAKLVKFFVHNPRLVWMIIAVLLVGGIFSLSQLRREGFPQISPKIVLVQTVYPGAPSKEVETQVTENIEAAVRDVKDVKDVSSSSGNSFSNVTVSLSDSANLDNAVQEIQSKVQAAQGDLPKDAEAPKVRTFSTGGPAFIFGVSEDKGVEEIRTDAKKLAEELQDVKGVKSAKLTNELGDRIYVSFDPAKLVANGVSLTTLSQALAASNVTLPAGTIENATNAKSVVTVGAFGSMDDIKNTIVGVNARTGRPVAISNVAEVKTGVEATKEIERIGFQKEGKLISAPGVEVSVELTSDADIVTARAAILKHIEDRQNDGSISKDIKVTPLFDQGKSTLDQVNEILDAAVGSSKNFYLLGGLQLLFIAMLLFVNWRAALISALAIPFSFGFTFITLALMGVQMNTIVLFSFILVLGLIVDPAIVMVEAIQRYRDLRYKRVEAVIESGRRYGASLFMAVLTSLIVFFPFAVVSGIFGQIIKYIPLTVIPALFASYMVPIALLPSLSKAIIKEHEHHHKGAQGEEEDLNAGARFVMKVNRWILARARRGIAVVVVSLILVVASVSLVGMGKVNIVQFSQPNDNPLISVHATFKTGLSLEARAKAMQTVEDKLVEKSGIDNYFYLSQSSNDVLLYVNLKEKKDRKGDTETSKAITKDLKSELASLPEFSDMLVTEVGSGTPESEYQIQTQLYDNDLANLEKAAKEVGSFVGGLEHVIKVDDGFTGKGQPELAIALDRNKVQRTGLSSLEVGLQVQSLLTDAKVTKYVDSNTGNAQDVYLANGVKPSDLDAVKNITLASRTGSLVKLSDIADVSETSTIDSIQRFNGSRYVNVQARVDDSKNTIAVQQKLDSYLTDQKIKDLGLDSRANKGDFEDIAKSFQELFIALAVAIALTYLVLVLQFKSFSLPAIMIITVPLSLIGVFPALWATGSDLGFLELLGVTILVGIVENVAIFLIDYANQIKKEKGIDAREAIIQASGVRFRPIILTKLVALGSLLPLAIESDFWRGLCVVIIAGIGLSGFFSLVVIPILYVWIEKLRSKIHKKKEA